MVVKGGKGGKVTSEIPEGYYVKLLLSRPNRHVAAPAPQVQQSFIPALPCSTYSCDDVDDLRQQRAIQQVLPDDRGPRVCRPSTQALWRPWRI